MKKRLLLFALVLFVMVYVPSILMLRAEAVGTHGVNFDKPCYTSENPFYLSNSNLWGQCTWYCWGRAKEKCGVDLPCRGNAQTWYNVAESNGLSVGTTPRTNSVAVFSKADNIGHVLFVESVNGSTVSYSEANYDYSSEPAKYNEGTFDINMSVMFEGTSYEQHLMGYIYLEEISFQFDEATGTLTISGTKSIDSDWNIYGIPSNNIRSIIIKDGITNIERNAFAGLKNLTSVVIPGSVASIGEMAFYSCDNLTSVSISNGVVNIGIRAFKNCSNLTSVAIPNSVTTIEDYAFEACERLNVAIPSGAVHIGENTFFGCKLPKNIIIPNSVISIGAGAFAGDSNIETIVVPNSVTSIGPSAFGNCDSLQSITWPATLPNVGVFSPSIIPSFDGVHVKFTGPGAMPDDSSWPTLYSVELEDGITHIGDGVFSYSKFSDIKIPNSVTSIGDFAFRSSIFSNITIPNSVTTIGEYAFVYCDNLTYVTIPKEVTSIGAFAFHNCKNLKDIYYGGSESAWIAAYHDIDHLSGATIHFNSIGPDTPAPPASLKEIVQQIVNGAKKVLGVASIRCPVDVEVYTGNQVVGRVVDNVVSDVVADKIFIGVENDEKYIYFLTNEEYTLRLTATGEGTMEYTAQNLDVPSWTALDGKYFRQVSLTSGKKMVSYIDYLNDELVDTPNVQLYVLDDAGEAEKVVLPDDKGTEVPVSPPVITFDSGVSLISVPPMAVGVDGTLSQLPAPTRIGYTLNGWYTASSGGDKITTDTVFNSNTTVYAQWSYVGTSNPSIPSTPSNPGGGYPSNYNPPATSYSISVPSVTGGTVSVSPTSAAAGNTVTITTTPNAGYELATLTVTDANGKSLELADKGDGKYSFKMPNGKVSLSAEFRPISAVMPWSNPFVDIAVGDWYYDAVKFVQENGLMNGVGNSSFAPNANLSRAMFAQILYNKEGRPTVGNGNAFNDVHDGTWYADAVNWAAGKGIVTGYGNNLFGPDNEITREQFVVMLYRYAGSPVPPNLLLNFTDAYKVSDWAQDAVRWAVDQSILNGKGDGILDPTGKATRAEAAQMLKNYLEK